MVALTAVMAFEKTRHRGQRGVVAIGVALVALGIVVLTHPSWLPSVLGS
jgi:uncharacterized membrane protein HdeD (DUF308 family)